MGLAEMNQIDIKIFIRTHDILRRESTWIQNRLASDEDGKTVGPESPDAVCWCMAGGDQESRVLDLAGR